MPIRQKICFFGESGVGKTSILERYMRNRFDDFSYSTIGAAFHSKNLIYNHKNIHMEIWDTAGQERFRSLAPLYYRESSVIILVVDGSKDVYNEYIFNRLHEYETNVPDAKVFIVINKCDKEQLITIEEMKTICKKDNISVFQVSAKTGFNVNELFQEIISHIYLLVDKMDEKEIKEKDKQTIFLNETKTKRFFCF